MKILFRVDAGEEIGLGHYYRSIALANELELKGHHISFICTYSDFWKQTIEEGFSKPVFFLQTNGCEYEIISKHSFDALFVDGNIVYTIDEATKIKELVPLIMYQNLTESRFYADIYILPSIHQNASFFVNFSSKTKIFKGLQYFTFNEKIKTQKINRISREVSSIAITTGGSDPNNVLLSLYKLISIKNQFQDIQFTFFYGKNFMHKELIPDDVQNFDFKEFDMANIVKSDLVISAFGVTSYELLALGIPLICIGHQKSTADASDYLAEYSETFISLGIYNTLTSTKLNNTIKSLLGYDARKEFSKKAKILLDFKGVNRVANIIEKKSHER